MTIVTLTVTVEDADGELYPVSIYVNRDNATTITQLLASIGTYWDTIAPLMTGVLSKATISLERPVSAFTNNGYNALSDVQEQALMRFAAGAYKSRLTIPTLYEAMLTNAGAGKELDTSFGAVQGVIDMMVNTVGGGGIDATDSHGVKITSFLGSEQKFKGR